MQQNFQTTGTLTGKVFKSLTPENVKLTGLSGQLGQMENDFEDMKRAREEAKRQLERKFDEVHRYFKRKLLTLVKLKKPRASSYNKE